MDKALSFWGIKLLLFLQNCGSTTFSRELTVSLWSTKILPNFHLFSGWFIQLAITTFFLPPQGSHLIFLFTHSHFHTFSLPLQRSRLVSRQRPPQWSPPLPSYALVWGWSMWYLKVSDFNFQNSSGIWYLSKKYYVHACRAPTLPHGHQW